MSSFEKIVLKTCVSVVIAVLVFLAGTEKSFGYSPTVCTYELDPMTGEETDECPIGSSTCFPSTVVMCDEREKPEFPGGPLKWKCDCFPILP